MGLLGKLEIRLDGAPLTELTSAKAQALLCYLTVTGRAHFRTSLAGLQWGDVPEASARGNLRSELSKYLRRAAGGHLIITREDVAFDRNAPYWLDVELFEAGAAQLQDVDALREAAYSFSRNINKS